MTVLDVFKNQSYLNLETTRKSGQAVLTPVWFVERDGALYVRTEAQAGKVKRIRNNPQVRIVPCGPRGELKGEWVAASAQLVEDGATSEKINSMLNKKYGVLKAAFDMLGKLNKREYTTIKIVL